MIQQSLSGEIKLSDFKDTESLSCFHPSAVSPLPVLRSLWLHHAFFEPLVLILSSAETGLGDTACDMSSEMPMSHITSSDAQGSQKKERIKRARSNLDLSSKLLICNSSDEMFSTRPLFSFCARRRVAIGFSSPTRSSLRSSAWKKFKSYRSRVRGI